MTTVDILKNNCERGWQYLVQPRIEKISSQLFEWSGQSTFSRYWVEHIICDFSTLIEDQFTSTKVVEKYTQGYINQDTCYVFTSILLILIFRVTFHCLLCVLEMLLSALQTPWFQRFPMLVFCQSIHHRPHLTDDFNQIWSFGHFIMTSKF